MLPGLNNVPFESPTLKEKRSIWRRLVSLARLASTASAADGAGLSGFAGTLNYTAQTLGAAVHDGGVNAMWFITSETERAAIKAKTSATDRTTLLQTLIDTYGRVILPAGRWITSAALLLGDDDALIGQGRGKTEILNTTTDIIAAAENFTVGAYAADMTLIGPSGSTATTASGVNCEGMERCTFERLDIYHLKWGMRLERTPNTIQCAQITGRDIYTEDCQRGIELYSPDDASDYGSINNCTFYNIRCHAVAYTWTGANAGFGVRLSGYYNRVYGLYTLGQHNGLQFAGVGGNNLVVQHSNEYQEAGHTDCVVTASTSGRPSNILIGTHRDGDTGLYEITDPYGDLQVINGRHKTNLRSVKNQTALLVGPAVGEAMTTNDYTQIGMRVTNSAGGSTDSGSIESLGAALRALQTGSGVNQAALKLYARQNASTLREMVSLDGATGVYDFAAMSPNGATGGVTHKIPININGTTWYLMASNVAT